MALSWFGRGPLGGVPGSGQIPGGEQQACPAGVAGGARACRFGRARMAGPVSRPEIAGDQRDLGHQAHDLVGEVVRCCPVGQLRPDPGGCLLGRAGSTQRDGRQALGDVSGPAAAPVPRRPKSAASPAVAAVSAPRGVAAQQACGRQCPVRGADVEHRGPAAGGRGLHDLPRRASSASSSRPSIRWHIARCPRAVTRVISMSLTGSRVSTWLREVRASGGRPVHSRPTPRLCAAIAR